MNVASYQSKNTPLHYLFRKESELHKVCKLGGVNKLYKIILSGSNSDIDERDNEGNTALQVACGRKYLEIMHVLIMIAGANCTILNNKQQTHWQVAECDSIIELLPLFDEQWYTRIHAPSLVEYLDVVQKLVNESPKDLNTCDTKTGYTLLAKACNFKDLMAVKYLLKTANIDVNLVDKNGDRPLILACKNNSVDIVKCLLKDVRTEVNLSNWSDGFTPLTLACYMGYLDLVDCLINTPMAVVHLHDKKGEFPLHYVIS